MNMFRATLTASAVALFAAVAPAGAADVYSKGSVKDEPFASVRKGDFSGFYVGLGAGGEFANIEFAGGGFDGIGADGLVGEAVVGFDMRYGSFVAGLRAIGGISNVNTEIGGSDLVNQDAYLNLGGRLGIVFNRTLVYGHAGYEMIFASSDIPAFDAALDAADLNAWTAGLGVETVITDHVSLTAEGTYVDGIDDAEGLEAFRGVLRLSYRH